MEKYGVIFGWCDEWGTVKKWEIELFETETEAKEYANYMKKGNGGYIKIKSIKPIDYNEYNRMLDLEIELAELKTKIFEI